MNNICHFVFGLKEQSEEFLFCYYISVFSAYLINNPDIIYFYYHYEPYGKWWDKLKLISSIKIEKIDVPTHIGSKKIKAVNYNIDTYKKKIYVYGIALTPEEKELVVKEAKEILDVEDVVASILIVDDLRIQKN